MDKLPDELEQEIFSYLITCGRHRQYIINKSSLSFYNTHYKISKITKKYFTLNTIPFKEIDMLSIIIIGNSQTTLIDEIFLTPRGYLQN